MPLTAPLFTTMLADRAPDLAAIVCGGDTRATAIEVLPRLTGYETA